jgi:hypothetical protein
MNRHLVFAWRAAIVVLVLSPGWALPGWSAQASDPATRTVLLRPAPGPSLRIDFNYNFRNALPPFEKEPAPAGKKTARGTIPTVPPTPFVRNITDEVLYLKVDHGGDFSEGSLVTYQSRYDGHVLFEGLQVTTERGALVIPYTVHVYTYETGCAGWFLVASGWEGELDLDGETWTLGIVDNLDGRIDGSDLLYLRGPSKLMPVCPAPETLFFAGRTFRLDLAFKSVDAEVILEAALTEFHPERGELNVEADGSRHLRLRSDRLTALLDDPAGTISLPVGTYRVEDCILGDERIRWAGPKFVEYGRSLSIQSGKTASVHLGKPLSNTVEVSRDRNLLRLSYQLVGAGGERYTYYNWRSYPSFTIYKGPLRIARGTFPFG